MHLKGVCWEVDWLFPMKHSHDREEKKRERKEKKNLIGLLQFPWVDFLKGWAFLRLVLPSTVATWEPGISGSECRYPGKLRRDSLLEIKSQAGWGRSASWELSPWAGRGVMTSWDPWTGGSPSRLRHDNFLRTRSLGRSRQVDLLGPLDWSWASPRSPVWPVLGRIKGL